MSVTRMFLVVGLVMCCHSHPVHAAQSKSTGEDIAKLKDSDKDVRLEAAKALMGMGPEAKDAAPALVDALDDDDGDVSGCARRALVSIGPDSVPALITGLRHNSERVRVESAYALVGLRKDAKPALPVLIGLLTDTNYVGNWRLGQAITSIGPDCFPPLQEALRSPDFDVRFRVAGVLCQCGEQALPAIPVFIEALKHGDVRVRLMGLGCIREMGECGIPAVPAVPALLEASSDKDATVRRMALATLLRSGADDGSMVATFSTALKDEDAKTREEAASSLGSLGVKAKGAVPRLLESLTDADMSVRVTASHALVRIQPGIKDVIPVLCDVITVDRVLACKPLAVQILGDLGQAAISAVPVLAAALQDSNPDVRRQAIGALIKMGPDAVGVIAALTDALKDSDYIVRLGAAEGLMRFGPKARASVPGLKRLLNDPESDVRREAAMALKSISGGTESRGEDK